MRPARLIPVVLLLCCSNLTAGELTVTPSASVNCEYSDNLFLDADESLDTDTSDAEDAGPVSDFVTVISPGIAVALSGSRTDASLSYQAGHTLYRDNSTLDSWRHDARVSLSTEMDRDVGVEVEDVYFYTDDPLASEDASALASREPYSQNTASIGMTRPLHAADLFRATYSHTVRRDEAEEGHEYDKNEVLASYEFWLEGPWGGQLESSYEQADFTDSTSTESWLGEAELDRRLSSDVTVFGRYRHQFRTFAGTGDDADEASDEDASGTEEYHVMIPECGLDYRSRTGGSLAIALGFFLRDYSDGESVSGPSGSLDAERHSSRSVMRLYGATGHDESLYTRTGEGASTYYEGEASISYMLTRALTLTGSVGYRKDDYDADAGSDDASEESKERRDIGLKLSYRPREWLEASLGYTRLEQDSESDNNDYQENRLALGVSVAFPYRTGRVRTSGPVDGEE